MPGEHTKVSASRVPALALCPGMLRAEATIREQPGYVEESSKAAEQGTKRHALLEWRQKNPSAPWPTQVEDYLITSEDVAAVDVIAPYFVENPARLDQDCGVWYVEERVEIGQWIGLEPDVFCGTIDGLFISRDTLEIVDAKFGHTVISPESWQLKAYAVGAGSLVEWGGRHRGINNDYGRVKLTIAQPTNIKNPIASVEYGINELENWGQELKKIADAALDLNAPRIPGDKQCHFCLARGSCRERLEYVARDRAQMFEDVSTQLSGDEKPSPGVDTAPPPVATVDAITDIVDERLTQDPQELSDQELGRLLDQALLLEGFIKDSRAEMERRLKMGKGLDSGWKMVAGRKKREWTVEDVEVEKTLRSCGLKVGEIYPKKLPSVASIEAKVKIKGKKQIEKLSTIFSTIEGKPVLAPEGDSRPSVREAMFEDISETSAEADFPSWLD